MFNSILCIPGKSGLFKRLTQTPKLLLVESLTTGQRTPIFSIRDVGYLNSMSLYTTGEQMPLGEALTAICTEQKARPTSFNPATATPDVLFAFLGKAIPTYNKDEVKHYHVRKILTWYNILVTAGITDFSAPTETTP